MQDLIVAMRRTHALKIHGFELVLKNTWDTRILNKSLEGTRFFEKRIPLVHRYKPHEVRF